MNPAVTTSTTTKTTNNKLTNNKPKLFSKEIVVKGNEIARKILVRNCGGKDLFALKMKVFVYLSCVIMFLIIYVVKYCFCSIYNSSF